ncbi:hypothetical protein ACTXN9_11795 [Corynebacterium casei]|uniref:hypothetical protein n=1 Tax=Corynebacterium casei TaxID=160386 RepID=UPI000EC6F5F1|nr:hypothetical protein [Corynebacterium casei]MDN5705612.1 hypothetical protein [Corynebacterium casei]MDN5727923.1 hypothetical protein [Corynebacterium casei]MDN5739935.1 hypothetical protein [Corynebacterium casei]MDN5784037.1 hypothetical protein [Corynebacterium casei]MDN5839628.1 hypothetical protein [Corynebacterium casei]
MSRYKTITIVAAVLTFGYALGHFTTTAMLSGEANSLLFLRNTVGLVVGSGILWASMSVWAGRVAGPRLWRSILAGTVIIFAMLAIHYAFGLLIGVFDDQIFSSNALWMYGSFISGPTFGLIGGLSHKFPWLLLIVPLGLIAEPFVINSIPARVFSPGPPSGPAGSPAPSSSHSALSLPFICGKLSSNLKPQVPMTGPAMK